MAKLRVPLGPVIFALAFLFGGAVAMAQVKHAQRGIRFIPTYGASSVIASAATIAPTNGVHHVSGVAAIGTITVPATCTPTCQIVFIPDGIFTTTTGTNISLASTAVVNKALIMVWDGTKWNPSY